MKRDQHGQHHINMTHAGKWTLSLYVLQNCAEMLLTCINCLVLTLLSIVSCPGDREVRTQLSFLRYLLFYLTHHTLDLKTPVRKHLNISCKHQKISSHAFNHLKYTSKEYSYRHLPDHWHSRSSHKVHSSLSNIPQLSSLNSKLRGKPTYFTNHLLSPPIT